jgi:hypothetical protein
MSKYQLFREALQEIASSKKYNKALRGVLLSKGINLDNSGEAIDSSIKEKSNDTLTGLNNLMLAVTKELAGKFKKPLPIRFNPYKNYLGRKIRSDLAVVRKNLITTLDNMAKEQWKIYCSKSWGKDASFGTVTDEVLQLEQEKQLALPLNKKFKREEALKHAEILKDLKLIGSKKYQEAENFRKSYIEAAKLEFTNIRKPIEEAINKGFKEMENLITESQDLIIGLQYFDISSWDQALGKINRNLHPDYAASYLRSITGTTRNSLSGKDETPAEYIKRVEGSVRESVTDLNTLLAVRLEGKDLYKAIFKLAAKDETNFVKRAKKTFEVYLRSQHIIDDNSPIPARMDKFLDDQFKKLYQQYDKRKPKTFAGHFIKLLNSFARWIGITDNKAKAIVENVIEHVKKDSEINKKYDSNSVELSAKIKITLDKEHPTKIKDSIITHIKKSAVESFTKEQIVLIDAGIDKILSTSCTISEKVTHIMSIAKIALTRPKQLEGKVKAIDSALALNKDMSRQLQRVEQQRRIITQVTDKILEKSEPLLKEHPLINRDDYKSDIQAQLSSSPYLMKQLTDKAIQEKFVEQLFKNLTPVVITPRLSGDLPVRKSGMERAQLNARLDQAIADTLKQLGLKLASSRRDALPKFDRSGPETSL